MGFHQKNSATVLLALLGFGSILGVNGSWLFGAMEEREEDYRRAMQPRQFVQCSSGSRACGVLGCVASRRCCNAGAGWGCLAGNACYTAGGFVDCYSTTMVMPTVSRNCYDFAQSGCTAGQACFKCGSTAAFCATEVLAGGGDTWLECATKSTVLTVTAAAETSSGSDGSDSTTTDDSSTTPTGRTGTSTPSRTGTTTGLPTPTSTSSSSGLGGGAIAGIVIGAIAGIAIIAALIFFLCVKKGDSGANGAVPVQQQYPQQQQQQQMYPPQPPYSPPPQQQYAPQPPYSPLPGYQGQMAMAHNGYGPDGQPLAPPPVSSPVYPEPSKQPSTMPAELH